MLKPCTIQDEFIITDQTLERSNRGTGFKDLFNKAHRLRSREDSTTTAAITADRVATGALHLPSEESETGRTGQKSHRINKCRSGSKAGGSSTLTPEPINHRVILEPERQKQRIGLRTEKGCEALASLSSLYSDEQMWETIRVLPHKGSAAFPQDVCCGNTLCLMSETKVDAVRILREMPLMEESDVTCSHRAGDKRKSPCTHSCDRVQLHIPACILFTVVLRVGTSV